MNETPQQYTERILGFVSGKEPLEVQRENHPVGAQPQQYNSREAGIAPKHHDHTQDLVASSG